MLRRMPLLLESGAAIVELALVLPVLMVLFFGALETVRLLEFRSSVSMFSHQAANIAFSECVEFDTLTPTGAPTTHISDCLRNRLSGEFQMSIAQIAPGTVVTVKVFVREGSSVRLRGEYTNTPGSGSQYSESANPGPGVDATLMDRLEKVVVAEVSYPYTPVSSFPLSVNLYEVTIY